MALATENPDVRLSNFLVAGGHLGTQQAADLMADSGRTGISLVNRLLAGRLVSQQVLAQGLASCAGLKFVPPSHLKPAPAGPRSPDRGAGPRDRRAAAHGRPRPGRRGLRATAHDTDPRSGAGARRASGPAGHRRDRRAAQGHPGRPTTASPSPNRCPSPRPTGRRRPPGTGASVAHIDELLECLLDMKGSDLHLAAGAKPTVRVQGELRAIDKFGRLDSDKIKQLLYDILSEKQIADYEHEFELDTAYSIPSRSRFRMNVFRQRGSVGAVLRVIPFVIPPFDGLGLPPAVRNLADLPRGLVLVTGPDRLGQVDDAGVADRHHQPHQGGAHHDVRGPHRVPAHPPAGHRQPARGGPGHGSASPPRCAGCCARTPTSSSSVRCATSRPSRWR